MRNFAFGFYSCGHFVVECFTVIMRIWLVSEAGWAMEEAKKTKFPKTAEWDIRLMQSSAEIFYYIIHIKLDRIGLESNSRQLTRAHTHHRHSSNKSLNRFDRTPTERYLCRFSNSSPTTYLNSMENRQQTNAIKHERHSKCMWASI